MNASTQGPSSSPLFDPSARRSRQGQIPTVDVAFQGWLFEFSWPGLVNFVQVSQSILVPSDVTITEIAYTFRTAQPITFQVRRDNSIMSTQAVSANGTAAVSIAYTAGQTAAVGISVVGGGAAEGLWVGMR